MSCPDFAPPRLQRPGTGAATRQTARQIFCTCSSVQSHVKHRSPRVRKCIQASSRTGCCCFCCWVVLGPLTWANDSRCSWRLARSATAAPEKLFVPARSFAAWSQSAPGWNSQRGRGCVWVHPCLLFRAVLSLACRATVCAPFCVPAPAGSSDELGACTT